jgi:hypothetical protein
MSDSRALGRDLGVERLFPRVHLRALGAAVGLTVGCAVFLLTAFHVVFEPEGGHQIGLLSWYFFWYDVTWFGAFVGLVWGAAVGFVAGWLLGFIRNLTLDAWLLVLRARTDLSQRRNFLDQIR